MIGQFHALYLAAVILALWPSPAHSSTGFQLPSICIRDALTDTLGTVGNGENGIAQLVDRVSKGIQTADLPAAQFFDKNGVIGKGQIRLYRDSINEVLTSLIDGYNSIEKNGKLNPLQTWHRRQAVALRQHLNDDPNYLKRVSEAYYKRFQKEKLSGVINRIIDDRAALVGDNGFMSSAQKQRAKATRAWRSFLGIFQDQVQKKLVGTPIHLTIIVGGSYGLWKLWDWWEIDDEAWEKNRPYAEGIVNELKIINDEWNGAPPQDIEQAYNRLVGLGNQLANLYPSKGFKASNPNTASYWDIYPKRIHSRYVAAKDDFTKALAAYETAKADAGSSPQASAAYTEAEAAYKEAAKQFSKYLTLHAMYRAFFEAPGKAIPAREFAAEVRLLGSSNAKLVRKDLQDAARELADVLEGHNADKDAFFGIETQLASARPAADGLRNFSVAAIVPEVSGSVLDRKNGAIWTLGDHGNGAVLGQTSLSTFTTDRVYVDNAVNQDWEAIVRSDDGSLWVLDVGDNERARSSVRFYQIDPSNIRNRKVSASRAINVTYEGGPVNVEAAVYRDGKIFLFEKVKGKGPVRVYEVPVGPGSGDSHRARVVATLKTNEAFTDAGVSPAGNVYLLTKTQVLRCDNCLGNGTPVLSTVKLYPETHVESIIPITDDQFMFGQETGQFQRW